MRYPLVLAAAAALAPAGASAQEVFVGVYDHAVDTPFTLYTGESGTDIAGGIRFGRVRALGFIGKPSPYVIASVNTQGDTSFVGGGLSWKIGISGPLYVRPGVGVVVHDGPGYRVDLARHRETDLGSRVLFEPEVALGYQLNDRLAVEASWMHISQGRVFNWDQNPGIDMMGARLNLHL
jgi:lipid A 3-O-deacylase